MSNYTKATNFATKDALTSGNPLKTLSGTELDDEFNAIQAASVTKANTASAQLTGIPVAPTAAADTSTTQLATTAFVTTEANLKADLAGAAFTGAVTTTSTIDGVNIATRDGVLTTTTTTADAALPKAGGALTGPVTTTSTVDGVDISARDAVLTATTTTANAALPKAGGTLTGDVSHVDNVKAKFGAGDDLQIYHDGSNSYIEDAATGGLHLKTNGANIAMFADTELMAVFNKDDGVLLYNNNALKLATTATGVDVTGTVTADGLVVASTGNITLDSGTGETHNITLSHKGSYAEMNSIEFAQASTTYGNNQIKFLNMNSTGSVVETMRISGGGDISFYEDTGTTPKFFWDASAESLGIGTVSPTAKLDVEGAGHIQRLKSTSANGGYASLLLGASGANIGSFGSAFQTEGGAVADLNIRAESNLTFNAGGAVEAMRIDSSGNVLVGTTSNSVYNDVSGTGIALNAGQIQVAGTGSALYLNRQGSDGVIQELRKDGTTVGSISSRGGSTIGLILNPASGTGAGLSGTTNAIFPVNETTTPVNGVVSLGTSANAFKDLYLSGGVYLGGVGAANLLDDYEEGTWVPVLKFGGGVVGITYSNAFGKYTKIGNRVYFDIYISLSSAGTSTGSASITLPVVPADAWATTGHEAAVSLGFATGLNTIRRVGIFSDKIVFFDQDTTASAGEAENEFNDNANFRISGSYQAA